MNASLHLTPASHYSGLYQSATIFHLAAPRSSGTATQRGLTMSTMLKCAAGLCLIAALGLSSAMAQAPALPDIPSVTVRGQTYTPRSIFERTMRYKAATTTALPPSPVTA